MNNLGLRAETFHFENWGFTMNMEATIVIGDVGKALAIDATAANTVKLAGDNDAIFGRLESFEDRLQQGIKIGTVSRKFQAPLPIKAAETVVVGDLLVGAGAGEVKAFVPSASASAVGTLADLTAVEVAMDTAIDTAFDALSDAARLHQPVRVLEVNGSNAIAVKE